MISLTETNRTKSLGPLAASPPGLELTIEIPRVAKLLLVIVSLLIVTGFAANLISNQVAPSPDHKLAKLMNRFDLAFEPSIPNWYSSGALLASAGLLGVIAVAKRRTRDKHFLHWLVLAVLFVGLSIDEGVRFHEMLHTAMIWMFGETHGILYFPWVAPATVFVAIVGLCYAPFLRNLDRRTSFYFMAAGGVYVFGAVGMDMIGGVLVEQHGMASIQHSFAQLFEELFEMLGVVVFICALLREISRCIGTVRFHLVQG